MGYLSNPFISTVYKSHDPSLAGHVCREWKGEGNRDSQGSILIRTTMYAISTILRRYCSRGWFVFEGSERSEASTFARHKITTHVGHAFDRSGLTHPTETPIFIAWMFRVSWPTRAPFLLEPRSLSSKTERQKPRRASWPKSRRHWLGSFFFPRGKADSHLALDNVALSVERTAEKLYRKQISRVLSI